MSTAAPKKKRVLFIINQFFRGGAETALVNLLRTMDSARFDVDLLIFDMIDLPGSLSLIPEIPDWYTSSTWPKTKKDRVREKGRLQA